MRKLHGKLFAQVCDYQLSFQRMLMNRKDLPVDDIQMSQYHVSMVAEELGEILRADKRWKTHRNVNYDPANKLEEIADVILCAINIGIFSGFTSEQIENAVVGKIYENTKRLRAEIPEEKKL